MSSAATASDNLAAAIVATLARRKDAPALHCEEGWLTFADLDQRSRVIAENLRQQGVEAGGHVAVGLANSAELVCTVLAVLRAGGVLVPINPALTDEELLYVLEDSEAKATILTPAHQAVLASAGSRVRPLFQRGQRQRRGGFPALIVYTSGTTGRPKGAVLTHHGLVTNFRAVADTWQWTEADRLLLVLPCFHLHGLGLGILASLMIGSSIVLRRRFELDKVLSDLQQHQATMFFGVPTIYNRLVAVPEEQLRCADLSRMRLWVSGSAPLNPTTYERFRQRFGAALMDRYGMTECAFALSTSYDDTRRAGVVGRALPGVEVRLVDSDRCDAGELVDVGDDVPGEILIKGPNLFGGYWRRPEETARAMCQGYLRSGDVAVRERDGQFRILGRKSVDIIKTRGFKVGAGEIEEVLQRFPEVEEVAVIGVPDADQGERIVAVVVAAGGAQLDIAQLLAYARAHLAPHKVPAAIEIVDELPKIGPGKFKKTDLIRRFSLL
ncbi:MAG TPA: AMP-binding protein [Terriglobales bacterium]|nr:AMP-binding protein [Terriglobales bacterium]